MQIAKTFFYERKGEYMVGIVIISHSIFAEALEKASEMITGKHDYIRTIGLEEGCEPGHFGEMITTEVNGLIEKGYQEVLILSDLFGGTPCNQAVQKVGMRGIPVVSGVNLPMTLQALMSNNDEITAKELAEQIIQVGQESIFNVIDR